MSPIFQRMIIAGILVMYLSSCDRQQNRTISGSGTIEATEVLVSAKTAGEVTDIWVKEGDLVKEGQRLAQIDSEKVHLSKQQLLAGLLELRLNLDAGRRSAQLAKDHLDNTAKKFQRIKTLLAEGSATQQQYDDLETALKAAETQYQNARTTLETLSAKEKQLLVQLDLLDSQLRDTKMTAPISGIVIEKYIEKGELARPGSPIVGLADLHHLWIKIYVKEVDLARIALNQAAEVKITAYPQQPFSGRVSWIAAKAEFIPKNVQTKEARADLVYAVKIEVENRDQILKIGMPADVILK